MLAFGFTFPEGAPKGAHVAALQRYVTVVFMQKQL